ncbi:MULTISPECIES: SDR family NAD(P)-dependent oxidoreductase [unclassified Haematobacter]|uniref:SDR family NAD(P)-dependent oxidoreductase n=1 Tax=unclassified Haematobacter TaxID=2640585 RepID=UPI0025C2A7A8|nr:MULTISPECIES: SDR family oxidoreductase [unclassified Haematobacter]
MKFDLDMVGKTALVIGGTGGIGNAIAQAYRALGATVHVWGTRGTAADYADVADSDMEGLHYHQMDVSDFAAVEAWQPPFGGLDILVQSQGIVMYGRKEYDISNFEKVLSVNLTSLMACTNKFIDRLVEAKGSVIIVSSSAAFHATRGVPAYGASKVGAMGLTKILAQTYAAKGVRVNGIAPGFIPTRLTAKTTEDQRLAETALARIPMGRFGTPQEMAGVAVFLASPLASYVTGQTILADGGMLL